MYTAVGGSTSETIDFTLKSDATKKFDDIGNGTHGAFWMELFTATSDKWNMFDHQACLV
jgi:hypothetical protein